MFIHLDRSARNATGRPKPRTTAVDDGMVVDDTASVCSNISDATSIYDEVEGKEIKKNYFK